MKWFFALNEAGLVYYADMVRAAVLSARLNTSLDPHLLWDGPEGGFVDWMRAQGVTVINCRTPLYEAIRSVDAPPGFIPHTADGAFLRLEVCRFSGDDAYVLYTDCDVLFLREPVLGAYQPEIFACAPEFEVDDWSMVNTGVMLMNVARFRADYDALHGFINERGPYGFDAYDQGALNLFYDGRWERLAVEYNWKVYWGYREDVPIVHFHGIKPRNIRNLGLGVERLPSDRVARPLYDRDPEAAHAWLREFERYEWGAEAPKRDRGFISRFLR
jgi:hypothetical protein